VSGFDHEYRRLERSYYRRVQLAFLAAILVHAAAIALAPPYVARPYRLDAPPLRLVAAGRVDAQGMGLAGAPPVASTSDVAHPAPRLAPVVTEQLRFSTQEHREERAAQGTAGTQGGEGAKGFPGGTEGGGDEGSQVFYAFDTPPRVIERVVPEYPPSAKAQAREGTVILNANVDEQGRVIRVWVIQATAPESLIEAAVDAMYRFRFAPGSRQGFPVKCTVAVPFNFSLNVHL
jgi:TonB family protein